MSTFVCVCLALIVGAAPVVADVVISGNTLAAYTVMSYYDGGNQSVNCDATGYYQITVPSGWSGTVTPSNPVWPNLVFNPTSRGYTNVTNNTPSQNYSFTEYYPTISGNAGAAGVTLSYTDVTAKTASADASGNYSFTVSYEWSGTVTPSKTGCTFSPTSKSYDSLVTDQTGQDYIADFTNVTISGNAGVAGATLSYTDGTAQVDTADGLGDYSFTVSYEWTGTVTPSKTGYTFSPTSHSYTSITSNQTGQDFTAALNTYTISGNAGVGGVIFNYTIDETDHYVDTADGDGNYAIEVNHGVYLFMVPSKTGYEFDPPVLGLYGVSENMSNADFIATPLFCTISGNAGIAGAILSYTDSTAKADTADGEGDYSFTVLSNWSGTVTPSKTAYEFTPASRTYNEISTNQTEQDYTAARAYYTISGNAGVADAVLSWTDVLDKTATADSLGDYTIQVSPDWSGTVRPSLTGYHFAPTGYNYNWVAEDHVDQDFVAEVIMLTISGWIHTATDLGIEGVALSGFPDTTVVTAADGLYTTEVAYNWSGTVTPGLTDYSFEPTEIEFDSVITDQTDQDFVGVLLSVGVDDEIQSGLPGQYNLSQNYPNPFNPITSIGFALPEATHVRLSVYNSLGQRVAMLIDQPLPVGYHQIDWDGSTPGGHRLSSGMYFYRLETGQYVETRKMILLK